MANIWQHSLFIVLISFVFEGEWRGGEGGTRVVLLDVLDMEYSEGEPKKYHKNYFENTWKMLWMYSTRNIPMVSQSSIKNIFENTWKILWMYSTRNIPRVSQNTIEIIDENIMDELGIEYISGVKTTKYKYQIPYVYKS